MALAITLPALAGREKRISFDQLPESAKTFILENFEQSAITSVKIDQDNNHTEYKVNFNDGTKVEFTGGGQWKEIENVSTPLPLTLMPEKIRQYLMTHHNGANIRKIEKDGRGFEVKLTNGIELHFDMAYNFVEYD